MSSNWKVTSMTADEEAVPVFTTIFTEKKKTPAFYEFVPYQTS